MIALDAVEARELDDDWYRTIFTEDARLGFPIGAHAGVVGLANFQRQAKARWRDTLHVSANHEIDVDGDTARVRAHVLGTHVHHGTDRSGQVLPHFDMGGIYEVEAVRGPTGWRFRELSFQVVWTSGPQLPEVRLEDRGARP